MRRRKICFVSGTRADFAYLIPIMQKIRNDEAFELQLVVTAMHLSPSFGMTYKQFEEQGFTIDAQVEMLLSGDTASSIVKSMGLATISFADVFERLRPDLLFVLGDRYEILCAVQAALIFGIPVGHIAGGDLTAGAYDEQIRHSISKMSHLHFVTNEQAAMRVRQMGENPDHVYNVGSPSIDYLKSTPLLSKEELENSLQYTFQDRNFLITYHPVTLGLEAHHEFEALLEALREFPTYGILFTKPNSDNGHYNISEQIDRFVASNPNSKAFISMGQLRYWSAMHVVDAVIGNSSSGLYEAPSLRTPTVDVGDRQCGRLQADSVLHCSGDKGAIVQAIRKAVQLDCSRTVNPYGDGSSSERIVHILKSHPNYRDLLVKKFYEVGT